MMDSNGIISALAIDQRGSLKKMLGERASTSSVETFKNLVSEELTIYSSSILLDQKYGLPASKKRAESSGLLLAYEETGYDTNKSGRLPDLLPEWSAVRLQEQGADAVKLLLYYDVDESKEINNQKQAFVERVGAECDSLDIPFFLEIVTYDAKIPDKKDKDYAKKKPHKVNGSMKEFSKHVYLVDVLKVEVPVDMDYVEGYGTEFCYSKQEAESFFREQNNITDLPFIFLSAGVSAAMFQETLQFAHEAGSKFNGVLCGRATWKIGATIYAESGLEKAREWLKT